MRTGGGGGGYEWMVAGGSLSGVKYQRLPFGDQSVGEAGGSEHSPEERDERLITVGLLIRFALSL